MKPTEELKSILDNYDLQGLKKWVLYYSTYFIRRSLSSIDEFYKLILMKLLAKDYKFFFDLEKGFSPYGLFVHGIDNIPDEFLKIAGAVKNIVDMADDDEYYNNIVHKFVKIWTKEEALNELRKSDWLYGDEPVYDVFKDYVSSMYE